MRTETGSEMSLIIIMVDIYQVPPFARLVLYFVLYIRYLINPTHPPTR